MADIDTISKYLIQHYPDDFAGFTLERDDVQVIDILDTEQPTVEARQTDSVIRVRIGEEEALLHNSNAPHRSVTQGRLSRWHGDLERVGVQV